MTAYVFTKTLRDQRRALIAWSIGVTALVVVEGALWPSVRDMPNLDEFLAGYPDALKEAFNLAAMTTGTGFLNAELYTLVLPILFLVFGISRGARLVAGEEESGTLEVVLVTPVSTTRLLLEKAAGLLTALCLLGAVAGVSTLIASALFSMGVSPAGAAVGALSMMLLGLEYGFLALAVGAMTGRRSLAVGVPSVAAVAAYVLYVGGLMVDSLSGWLAWSPFHQALSEGPIASGLPFRYAWMVLAAVVVVAVAAPVFARRDIRAT
ncbi:ABC transporter permease subunit [Nocardioides agariphilus]|uniref:ABC transporter permease subunit n=1 Tax=Nocardioides agariphilus TaxID=433664 RepID=A0A930VI90_9ACTN|nr:ABC transporter permease subunit [Nocardioides agariphilus]